MNNRDDAKFCKSCGTPATVSVPSRNDQAGIITIADNMPQGLSVFDQMVGLEAVFISGLRSGERVVLTKFPATIGRDPNSSLPLALHDQLASTRHAQIRYENRRFILKDVGSSNGTFREGQRITESTLGNQDVIEFGIGGPKIRFSILANGQSIETPKSEAPTLQPVASPAPMGNPPPPMSLGQVSTAESLPDWAKNAPIPPNATFTSGSTLSPQELPPPVSLPPEPPPQPVPAPPPAPAPVVSLPPPPPPSMPPSPPPFAVATVPQPAMPVTPSSPAPPAPVMVSPLVEGQLPATESGPPKKKGSTVIIIIALVLVIFILLLAVAGVVAWKFLK
jgi:hypothetical protein